MTVGRTLAAAPPPPTSAAAVFGVRLELAVRYAELLATEGVLRGLIGPREAVRLWDRHLLNCAVVGELIEADARVGDLGSGAGLPGIALAIARPDLRIELIEPLQRRAAFLRDAVSSLGLDGPVSVLRSRGEDAQRDGYDVVVARAVAALDRLVPVALPLARLGGTLLAIKGAAAAAELAVAARVIDRAGGAHAELMKAGAGKVEPATVVIAVRRARIVPIVRPTNARGRRA